MPSAATQLSSIDDFFAKEQLLGDYIVSISGQNSLRSSRLSLIKSKCGFGYTLGFVVSCSHHHPECQSFMNSSRNLKLDRISEELASKFDPKRIKQNVRWMAETSHISGTVENLALIRRIADEYRKLGFTVDTYNYTVLLNYPDFENANTVMVEKNGGMWWRLSRGRGHPRGPRRAVNEVVLSSA
uniref:4a-hydroxytetrahydrobiopterin dehydratase n=1 Tax=Angiostrongylus cantonensis TaxID=6313 RepID=A0A0K0DQH3_ANGCA